MENIHLINVSTHPFHPESDQLSCAPMRLFPESASGRFSGGDFAIALYSDYLGHYIYVTSSVIYAPSEHFLPDGFIARYAEVSPGGSFVILASPNVALRYTVDDGRICQIFECETTIVASAYRSDERFFAIATASKVTTYVNESLALHGTFETDNIAALAWNPPGTWLAVAAGAQLFFREKNCCERQTIAFSESLISVAWSADPDVLAVIESTNVILLSTKNRVFHRKFAIAISGDCDRHIFWARSALSLSLLTGSGELRTYEFNQSVDADNDSVFVFDGNKLLVSDWCRSLIPPPLCHRTYELDSQLTAIASDGAGNYAVFSQTCVTFLPSYERAPIVETPVQTACFRDGRLFYAVGADLYEFREPAILQPGFISFLTSTLQVIDRVLIGDRTLQSPATLFVENDGTYAVLCVDGSLWVGDKVYAQHAHSVLFSEKLLTYVDVNEGRTLHTIIYGDDKAIREIEPGAKLFYFCRRLFSIVIQMTRGNTETVAPHVLVEAAMRDLIVSSQYSEALRISKRYQVPFSRFITLGQISTETLCEQVPDTQLRQFIPNLRPITVPSDLSFLVEFLTYILGVPVTFDKVVLVPPYSSERELVKKFATTVCITFILLESPVSAVSFACSFSDSSDVKTCITFLLTLYDANELYDISLKTYDTRCIASVGLLTMREPSTYVPFVEELNRVTNPHLRKALIDEATGDSANAITEYSQCGPDYEEKTLFLIQRESAFDVGLAALPSGSPAWTRVCRLKLESLSKSTAAGDIADLAYTALRLRDPEQILRFARPIIDAGVWRLALPLLDRAGHAALRDALTRAKRFAEAAYVSLQYLDERPRATELFVKAHAWIQAVESGAAEAEVANAAFTLLMAELQGGAKEARLLREKFADMQAKQSEHADAPQRRSGRSKTKRGLPAIAGKMAELLPSEARSREVGEIVALLITIGQADRAQELRQAFRELCRSVWPIPHLPDGEEMLVPAHLQDVLG
jgi:elongator complex protein 1